MQSHGVFTGGAVVVTCTGAECPEFGIQRKWMAPLVDLETVAPEDLVPA